MQCDGYLGALGNGKGSPFLSRTLVNRSVETVLIMKITRPARISKKDFCPRAEKLPGMASVLVCATRMMER